MLAGAAFPFAAALLLSLLGIVQPALAADVSTQDQLAVEDVAPSDPALVEKQYQKALKLARGGQTPQALALLAPMIRDPMRFPHITADYLVILTWDDQKARAIKLYEQLPDKFEKPDYLIRDMAQAYMDEGMFDGAVNSFQTLLTRNPDEESSQTGLVRSIFQSGKPSEAEKKLAQFMRRRPSSLELRLLRPWMLEQQGRLWEAVLEYEAISREWPGQTISTRRALIATSHMGASSYALKQARQRLPADLDLQAEIRGDIAVDYLNWNEPKSALEQLQPLLDKGNLRARYDAIVALIDDKQSTDAIQSYEQIISEGITPPNWVKQPVARAKLNLRQPEEALELYDQVLASEPKDYSARMGKTFALMDMGRIRPARQMLTALDEENGWTHGAQPNHQKTEIAMAQGWLFADEGALNKAEAHFRYLHELAPANDEFRGGLGQTYMYRGWPRKAMREFQILTTLNPGNTSATMGSINAQNSLAMKQQARARANALLSRQPNNIHVRRMMRELEVDAMRSVHLEIEGELDNDGSNDFAARLSYAHPITLSTQLTGFILRRKSSQLADYAVFERMGLGVEHTFNSVWHVGETLSWDFGNGGEPGSRTTLRITPDDYWRIDLAYDSFSTDVALRARATGIESSRFELGVTYRESDWREYALGLNYSSFSDGNNRNEAFVRYEQGLWARENWSMRIMADVYASTNSLDNAVYFNPSSDWSMSATHLTRHTFYRRYEKRFSQSLYVTLGGYWQSGFSGKAIAAIRYGHNYDFTDTQSLEWSIGFASRPYDGVNVASRSYYLAYLGRF